MTGSIFGKIQGFTAAFKAWSLKGVLSFVLTASLLLTINAEPSASVEKITQRINEVVSQSDSQRPKTTGEWNKEARETEGRPVEKLKRIVQQSGEAVQEFGEVYPETAEKSVAELERN